MVRGVEGQRAERAGEAVSALPAWKKFGWKKPGPKKGAGRRGTVRYVKGKARSIHPERGEYVVVWSVEKKKTCYEHRLIWERVHGPIKPGFEINHINGIKNDNRLENLELVTRAGNQRHAVRSGLLPKPPRGSHTKLTRAQVEEIKRDYVPRIVSHTVLAKRYRVNPETVARILRGEVNEAFYR